MIKLNFQNFKEKLYSELEHQSQKNLTQEDKQIVRILIGSAFKQCSSATEIIASLSKVRTNVVKLTQKDLPKNLRKLIRQTIQHIEKCNQSASKIQAVVRGHQERKKIQKDLLKGSDNPHLESICRNGLITLAKKIISAQPQLIPQIVNLKTIRHFIDTNRTDIAFQWIELQDDPIQKIALKTAIYLWTKQEGAAKAEIDQITSSEKRRKFLDILLQTPELISYFVSHYLDFVENYISYSNDSLPHLEKFCNDPENFNQLSFDQKVLLSPLLKEPELKQFLSSLSSDFIYSISAKKFRFGMDHFTVEQALNYALQDWVLKMSKVGANMTSQDLLFQGAAAKLLKAIPMHWLVIAMLNPRIGPFLEEPNFLRVISEVRIKAILPLFSNQGFVKTICEFPMEKQSEFIMFATDSQRDALLKFYEENLPKQTSENAKNNTDRKLLIFKLNKLKNIYDENCNNEELKSKSKKLFDELISKMADQETSNLSTSSTHVKTIIEDDAPEHFYCPINGTVMENPYQAPCGHNFEKSAIEIWIQEHHNCPICRRSATEEALKPNLELKNEINTR